MVHVKCNVHISGTTSRHDIWEALEIGGIEILRAASGEISYISP